MAQNKKELGSSKAPTNTIFAKVQSKPVEAVKALIADSYTVLSQRTPVWDRHRRKYRRGLYYLAGENRSLVYFTNYIYSTIETLKATLTKNMPAVTVAPKGEKDDLAADIMSRVITDVMIQGNISKALKGMVHNGLLSSIGYIKTYFDPIAMKIKYISVLPDNLLVDPLANTLDDCRWVVHKTAFVSVEEIYATYGVIPEEVSKKESSTDELYDKDDYSDGGDPYDNDQSENRVSNVGKTFDVYEAWIRVWDEDRENDWYIVTIAGNTVLREEFSIYEHNQHPFDVWFCIEDETADNIYYRGVGAVEEIESLQDRADAIDFKIMRHLNLMTNRQRYVSTQSGLNANAIDNTAGRVYMVQGDPSKTVYYDVPPALNQEIYNYKAETEPAMQTVSGVFDVMQGRKPSGITAGRAISELKDSAETRTGCMSDTIGEVLERIGSKTMSIVFQIYDNDMLLKATDADEEEMHVVIADYPEELQPQPILATDENGEFIPDENGEFVMDEEVPEVDEELQMARDEWKKQNNIALVLSELEYEWDVKIDTSSALPAVKAERGQLAADLFRLGAVDRKAVLDTLEFPNRRKILSRIEAEVTGKNAGDPNAEAGAGAIDMLMQQFQQVLQQAGAPPEAIQQIMEQLMMAQQGGAEGGSDAQTGQGNFPPQVV